MSRKDWQRRWVHRAFARLRRRRRNRCLVCGVRRQLQWAHRRSTGLDGPGRGSIRRLQDIRRFPRRYALLCVSCHRLYDRGFLHPPSQGQGWRCDRISEGEKTWAFRSDPGEPFVPSMADVAADRYEDPADTTW